MNTFKHICFLLVIVLMAVACDGKYSDYPAGPDEYVYDTIDCSGWNIPAGAITVREALRIGKELGKGGTSTETYLVKGLVSALDAKYHESGMQQYGNACFYIQDNMSVSASFYGFQVLGMNGSQFTSLDQLQVGDFVVIKCKITNYNGTIETTNKGAANLVFSTNDLAYPLIDHVYFEEEFTEGLGAWTQKIVTDPGITVWNHNVARSGTTSALAEAAGLNSEVWLVSPAIDMGKEVHSEPVKLAFQNSYVIGSGEADPKEYMRLKVRGNGKDWTDMEIPNFNTGSRVQYVPDTLDISAFAGTDTQVAFAYKSTPAFAPKWNINSISVIERKRSRQ